MCRNLHDWTSALNVVEKSAVQGMRTLCIVMSSFILVAVEPFGIQLSKGRLDLKIRAGVWELAQMYVKGVTDNGTEYEAPV